MTTLPQNESPNESSNESRSPPVSILRQNYRPSSSWSLPPSPPPSTAKIEIATLPPSTIVPEVLKKDNYERWSIIIKHYLVAQDVWDVVEPRPTTEETNERVWTKKDALALHAIKISCGAKAFDLIKNKESAREAWKELLDMPKVPVSHDIPIHHESVSMDLAMPDEEVVLDVATPDQEVVPPDMATPDQGWQRYLHRFIRNGRKRRVEQLLYLFPNAMSDQEVVKSALDVAITAAKEDMARFLCGKIGPQVFLREDYGFILLEECITKKMFKIALDLLVRFPKLATKEPSEGHEPIIVTLAKTSPPFYRRSQLKFVRLWIYRCMEVNVELINPSDAAHGASGEEHSCYQSCLQFLKALPRKSVTTLSKILAKQTYGLKSTDVYADKVVSFLCAKLVNLDEEEFCGGIARRAMFEAIRNGNPEIAIEIAEIEKKISWTSKNPEESRVMFARAIAHRQEKVAKYFFGYMADKFYGNDKDGNNNLHLAAKLGPQFELDCASGAALQLQSELRWFKSVEAVVPRFYNEQKNIDGETPYQVFVKEHKNLLKEAEEWMKRTAESSTVVAALIITIMFAAAFTVPGGNDQNTGFPIFLNKTAPEESFTVTPFKVFIVSDAISLFTASGAVLMFLGILTSSYAYEDFLTSLPTKLIFGLISLFISIATLTVAFCATLYMMLRDQRKEFIPITVLAGIPIMCFVLLQFPLLVEITALTLRPYIFDRKTATARWVEWLGDNIPILSFVVDVVIDIKDRLISYLRCRKPETDGHV